MCALVPPYFINVCVCVCVNLNKSYMLSTCIHITVRSDYLLCHIWLSVRLYTWSNSAPT